MMQDTLDLQIMTLLKNDQDHFQDRLSFGVNAVLLDQKVLRI